ncbi:MAG: PatU [Nostocaceae cyanobacterium CSU_2_110]|nr:PatU [Richelia sp. SM2_1_7]NJM20478.1 PatU [Richelia sp. SM1_7_0]NJN08103.1 PatU [Richelia sp. RM1_1_1]NJO28830.1 PatU [Richelia sp. SL_2_1]NJS16185.1 PatU [Nostocaceae cyanobacterium CSU_2_110]
MNSDTESLQNQLLAWLLADNAATEEDFLVECEEINGAKTYTENTASTSGASESDSMSYPFFQLGEIPTVQTRFQAVLKRRLQSQVQDNPPLFPWETQLVDYPDYIDNLSMNWVPAHPWAAQQSKLSLPIAIPEKIFQQLLAKCQELLSFPVPLGAKLVGVVESLFPNEPQMLNDLAGMVLRSPYRSADTLERMPYVEGNYSDLQPRQQMALSLLAAKQLLENLTLSVDASEEYVSRQWLTNFGTVTLSVKYDQVAQTLRVEAELPHPGQVKLEGDNCVQVAKSSNQGIVSLELNSVQQQANYTLAVELNDMDTQPLYFTIVPTSAC